ncbi:MAG: hypothetical protein LAT67_13835 [Balneolales bacterium]|nr:hypothetical protein [Balneolales bacterium]
MDNQEFPKISKNEIEEFRLLLKEFEQQFNVLQRENKRLKEENKHQKHEIGRLKASLEKKAMQQNKIQSNFSDKDRLILKQQIMNLVRRIDGHLQEAE